MGQRARALGSDWAQVGDALGITAVGVGALRTSGVAAAGALRYSTVRLSDEECWARLRAAEHGVLCTLHPDRALDAVPVCYAVAGVVIATPVDRVKAKRTMELARSEESRAAIPALRCCASTGTATTGRGSGG